MCVYVCVCACECMHVCAKPCSYVPLGHMTRYGQFETRQACVCVCAHLEEIEDGHGSMWESMDEYCLQKTLGVMQGPAKHSNTKRAQQADN